MRLPRTGVPASARGFCGQTIGSACSHTIRRTW
nr:MAG TPA: hypothetical protein [Bacteriophage sp.]